jgi:hypothetical protein
MTEKLSTLKILMRLLFLLICLTTLGSCHKVICEKPEKNPPICANAVVQDAGKPEVDGLGWVLRLENGETEKPSNLPDNFKTNGLAVTVCYEKTTEKHSCFCAQGFIYMVKITSIKKR